MEYTLDDGREEIVLSSTDENREMALMLAQQAKHEILIASYDLDSRIYSNNEFIDALSIFVRSHRNARVHIMVWQAKAVARQGHRLIDLSQRLSSNIKIHEPAKVHAEFIESFMVIDGTGYFHRPQADRLEGVGSLHAPLIARNLKERFIEMWERSIPSTEFRRLKI